MVSRSEVVKVKRCSGTDTIKLQVKSESKPRE